MPPTIVERHYAIEGEKNTKNMKGVLEEIPKEKYWNMFNKIKALGNPPSERGLGQVKDETAYYYNFEGNNVLLENGLAQAGSAITTDNMTGFKMTRLFANSLDKMNALEVECGLR